MNIPDSLNLRPLDRLIIKSRLVYNFLSLLERLYKKTDSSTLYFSNKGVKCINQQISSDQLSYFSSPFLSKVCWDDLHLGCDGLYDSFTMMGLPIKDSPHYELIETLLRGADLSRCEYFRREALGMMNYGKGVPVSTQRIQQLRQWFDRRIQEVQSTPPPIFLAKVSDQVYVLDGRHTATICLQLRITPRYLDGTPSLYDSFFFSMFRKMKKRPNIFQKHISFFETLYDCDIIPKSEGNPS